MVNVLSEKFRKIRQFNGSIYIAEFLLLLIIFGFGCLTIEGFASPMTVVSLLILSSFLGIAAGGQTLVVLLGCIDLSIPGMIALGNVLTGILTGRGWSFTTILLLIIAIAIIVGVINALVSKFFKIHAMITTLATGAIIEGSLLVLTKGALVSSACPEWLSKAVSFTVTMGPIPLPPLVGIWVGYTIIMMLLLYKTAWGKRVYASGVNDRAAQLALVNTTSIWVSTFILSALSAALAGILLAGFSGSAYIAIGKPYLFQTISAVVIGGTSLIGGRGGIERTFFGALLLTLITTIMIGFGLGSALQQALLGFIIILLMSIYGREQDIRMRL